MGLYGEILETNQIYFTYHLARIHNRHQVRNLALAILKDRATIKLYSDLSQVSQDQTKTTSLLSEWKVISSAKKLNPAIEKYLSL